MYVVDYNKPVCEHEWITVLTHEALRHGPVRFDYAISFSSFEHDGLGRYGDPLSPYGDIKAMQFARTVMKEDGVLFLGVPTGRDALVWNAHRIYGPKRLPLLLSGWLPLDAYSVYLGRNLFAERTGTHENQPLLALRKTRGRTASKEEILASMKHAREVQHMQHPGTRDGGVLLQILELLLEAGR